ncbi:hypothetical protein CD932_19245 [Janthinobacterium sp. PC23-8]|nr:hypothetical protein CD932_19245 [Janthinobacterium sp. PC23-8]
MPGQRVAHHPQDLMADIGLQAVNGEDHASLGSRLRGALGQGIKRQAEQDIVLHQQVRHA